MGVDDTIKEAKELASKLSLQMKPFLHGIYVFLKVRWK